MPTYPPIADLLLAQNLDMTQTEVMEMTTEWTEQICRSVSAVLIRAVWWPWIGKTFSKPSAPQCW